MPIYEYRCESCGHELEKMQKLADAPLTDCPACGRPALRKKISAAGFRLKGGGWYETDFKQGGKKNLHDAAAKEGGGETAKSGESPAAASTPAKPAEAASPKPSAPSGT